jgi:hypothetical protein
MNAVPLMQRAECSSELQGKRGASLLREASLLSQHLCKRPPNDAFHDQVGDFPLFAYLVDRTQVAMKHISNRIRLATKPRQDLRVGR